MIRLRPQPMETVEELRAALQKAIQLELSTLPPYLYALFSLQEGSNEPARARIAAIVREEMVHMALACNVLNAIGGNPVLADPSVVPVYPGPLPYDIGGEGDGGEPFIVRLLPFSEEAMCQAMRIEEPEDVPRFPEARALPSSFQTIGQFYAALSEALLQLPEQAWTKPPRNQLTDHPFFPAELVPVTNALEASRALQRIVSDGEGTTKQPLDWEGELAHYHRFDEIHRNQVLQEDSRVPEKFSWGGPLGVDWDAVVPAIADPGEHDFSQDPAAQAAQDDCDGAYTAMLQELHRSVNGEAGRLGNAVSAMFDLTRAARRAFRTPLAGSERSAGPAFRFRPVISP